MAAKTFDRQTAKLIAVVGENMPELSGGEMQWWIQHPKKLQDALKETFCLEEETTGIVKSTVYPYSIIAVQAMGVSQDISANWDLPGFWGQEILHSAGKGDRVRLVVRLVAEEPPRKNYLKIVGMKEVIKDE